MSAPAPRPVRPPSPDVPADPVELPVPLRPVATIDQRIATLLTIRQDIRDDVQALDGRPFDGRTVAVAFGQLSAIVDALAGIVLDLLVDERGHG
jgi:hypothetical protein